MPIVGATIESEYKMVFKIEAAQNIALHLDLPVGLAHTFTKPMIAKALGLDMVYDFKATRNDRAVFRDTANYLVTFGFEGCQFQFKAAVDKNGSGFRPVSNMVVMGEFKRVGGAAPQSKQYRMAVTNINNLSLLNVLREMVADLHFYGGDYPEVSQCWVFSPFTADRSEIKNFEPEFFGDICYSYEQAVANSILLSPYLGAFLVVEFQDGKLIRNESVYADILMTFKPHQRVWMKAMRDVANFIDKRGLQKLS